MNSSALLFLHCHTALHCGSGAAVGSIDLPVQRERHTGWPLIPAATIKGVLRDRARLLISRKDGKSLEEADKDKEEIEAVFGPSKKRNAADEHAGAIAFTDAWPLLFPVRSLKGLFAWVTCPAALERYSRDCAIAGQQTNAPFPANSTPEEGKAQVEPNSHLLLDGQKIVLEEFEFTASSDEKIRQWADSLSSVLSLERLKGRLAVLSDDEFTHFVRNATEIQAHIALDYETKTVSQGALFYTEYIPPETVFVSLAIAENSHKGKENAKSMTAQEILATLDGWLKNVPLLQIGGDATTGKGLCRPILHQGGAQ